MSADNGVYVLSTISTHRKEGNAIIKVAPHKVFRVAHAQAIDNFEWYKENQLHNVGCYMKEVWGKSPVFTDKARALLHADAIAEHVIKEDGILEYGISTIDTDFIFYGD